MQPDYRIYPSLLDNFGKYLRADEEVESFWNVDNETGEYKRSPEEIEADLKQQLLNAINRVPFESEAADKGTAFHPSNDMQCIRKLLYHPSGRKRQGNTDKHAAAIRVRTFQTDNLM